MKNLHEKNRYEDQSFPFEIYTISKTGVVPEGRGFDDTHWHEELQLTVVKKGKIKAKVNGEDLILNQDDGLFINKDVLHQMTDMTGDSNYISLNFPADLLGFFPHSRMEKDYVVPIVGYSRIPYLHLKKATDWQNKILGRVKNIEQVYHGKEKFGWEYRISILLCEIWYNLISSLRPDRLKPSKVKDGKYARALLMIQFIHDSYSEQIQLSDIASSAKVSQSEANRIFKMFTGKTPYKFLADYRLYRGKLLLDTTDLSVTEIAVLTGFSDTSHFIQTFKKEYDITPGRYKLKVCNN